MSSNHMKIFVSYSRTDAGHFAEKIHKDLATKGNDIFIDVKDIKVGNVWSNTIKDNISKCDVFIVIITPEALRSPHIDEEIRQAKLEKKQIIPCFHKYVRQENLKWSLENIQGISFDDKHELALNLYTKIDEIDNTNTNLQTDNRLNFYTDLCDELKGSKATFSDQLHVRDYLMNLLEKDERMEIKDILQENLEYEQLFRELCPLLNDEQRLEFNYIRKLTDRINRYNSSMYELLNDKNNRKYWDEVPRLRDLFYHLSLWLDKYETRKDDRCTSLVFVGVGEGRPFPHGIDDEVCKKIC